MYIIWTPSTLPLGHRDILFSKLNYLLDNKIYTKNKLQFSCSLFICGGAFFCKNTQCVEFVGYFRGRAPPWKFDRTVNAGLTVITARRKSEEKLPTADVVQGNLGLPLLPNSPDLHQNNKMKSCADPASSFPWVTPRTKTIKSWNNPGDVSLLLNCASVLKFHSHHPE